MPRLAARVCVVLVAWAVLGDARGHAQALGSSPSADPHGFVGFASTRVPGPWLYDLALSLSQEVEPLRQVGGAGGPALQQRSSAALQARLGLGGRGALTFALPVVMWAHGAGAEPGLADGLLGAAVRVWGAPSDARGDTKEGGGVSVDTGLSLPWGRDASLAAEPKPRLSLGVTADMRAFGVVAALRGAYARRFDAPPVAVGRDRLDLALASQIPVPLISRLAPERLEEQLVLELALATNPAEFFRQRSTALSGRGMWRLGMGDWALAIGCEVGLLRALDTPVVRPFVALYLSPRVHDADHDGVADGPDACPALAEDIDGFEDADGCPEPDNDADGILDEDDLCPLQAADYELDRDEDGCNDRS